MATISQSIDIKVPVQTAYNQLTQFEAYPMFMQEVVAVRQLDDTHLHWKTLLSDAPLEWVAEITEQQPDRCIAWRNTSGPAMGGRVEVQPVGPGISRVTFTLQSDHEPAPGLGAASSADEMSQRLLQDLARLKQFIESQGETGAWRGAIQDGEVVMRDRDARAQEAGPGDAMARSLPADAKENK